MSFKKLRAQKKRFYTLAIVIVLALILFSAIWIHIEG